MIGKSSGAGVVPFLVGGVELAPGEMFRVSGSDRLVQFIRIIKVEAENIFWEALSRSGKVAPYKSALPQFQHRFQGVDLKYQAIVPDEQWEAFAAFLKVVSRWQLDRSQTWLMWLWFDSMAIEREITESRQRKEAGKS